MVIRLNRVGGVTGPTGVYRCEVPGAGGGSNIRYVTLRGECEDNNYSKIL